MTQPEELTTGHLKQMFLYGFITMKRLGEDPKLWPFTLAAIQIRGELKRRGEWDSWIEKLGKNKEFMNGEGEYIGEQ